MPVRTRGERLKQRAEPETDSSPDEVSSKSRKRTKSENSTLQEKLINFVNNFLFNPQEIVSVSHIWLCVEFFLCIAVVNLVKYTEIDWSTYMQQVQCFLNGTLNYAEISGDTGPIVYPAGHLYIYTALYYLTNQGTNIRVAQYIFVVLFLLYNTIVWKVYGKVQRIPPYALLFSCITSYRVHSLFVLRLFNDPIAMLLFYMSLLALCNNRSIVSSILYSIAVSVKMNILLMAPALGAVWVLRDGWTRAICHGVICALVQAIIGAPFLYHNCRSYIARAFNLGRVFLFKWTVNWRFLPEHIFTSWQFHISLLALHLIALVLFASFCWFRFRRGLWHAVRMRIPRRLTPDEIAYALFTANFIGLAFSRSLHYQFYVWYHGTLPYLLWTTAYPSVVRLLLLLSIEVCWNIYPSTVYSSALLHVAHGLVLIGLVWEARRPKIGL